MALMFGMMMQQSVTDDVNEYYWTVEADDAPAEEAEVVVADTALAACADFGGSANPSAADGMWTWAGEQFQCRVIYNGTNGFVEEYLNGAQCFS